MASLGSYESFQNCFRVRMEHGGTLQGGGGKRGQIKGLSKGSRRKLVFLINSFAPVQDAFFVTLTVREASEDFKQWKKWLNRTLMGLRYKFPQLSGIWRLEFQKNGSPHFHLLLFTNTPIDPKVLRSTIRRYWSSACGKQNTGYFNTKRKHWVYKGIRVEKVRDIRKSGFYLAIYQAKNEQDRTDIPTGKTWGILNRESLPVGRYEGGEFETLRFNTWCKRLYRRYIKANGASTCSPLFRSLKSRDKGFTGFLPRSLQRKFFALCGDLSNGAESKTSTENNGSNSLFRCLGSYQGIHKKEKVA